METSQRPREILPTNVKPTRCVLELEPDIEAGTFNGSVTYDIDVIEATTAITVNATDLEVEGWVEQDDDGQAGVVSYDKERERATISFERPLEAGTSVVLELSFKGSMTGGLCGLYRSEYTLADGTKKAMAATQFEAADARRAFPCWDEPAIKMPYIVDLIVPEGLTAISNGRMLSEYRYGEGKKCVTFEETPTMSTYLLAFIVGDLRSITATTPDGIEVRGWATPGKETQCQFAVDLTAKVLAYFAEYFGLPYPLPKVDLIAIPDFAAGAMENWGAITFRETALLVDEANSSLAARQRVAEVVAHELAHMWFGDLVTMEWWNDLWLNESFATWMANKVVHELFPEWNTWSQFVAGDMVGGMTLDGLRSSHPIEVDIFKVAEVDEVFDAISYDKGGSVLRMIEQHIGEDVFRDGLRIYMRRHQYANTRASDLWNALGEASGDPNLATLMSSWTGQTGYPTIDVAHQHDRDGRVVYITQTKFCYGGIDRKDVTCWQIPVGIVVYNKEGVRKGTVTERVVGKDHVADVTAVDWATGGFVHANAKRAGFYRVNYDTAGWKALIEAVRNGHDLTAEERFGLQDDAFALSEACVTPVTTFLDLAGAFKDERSHAVWAGLAGNLAKVHGLIGAHPVAEERFKRFAHELFADVAARVGWNRKSDDTSDDILLRGLALEEAGRYGNQEVIDEARRRFDALVGGASSAPDTRAAIYRLTAKSGGVTAYEDLLDLYRKETLQEEKVRVLLSLGSVASDDLLERTLAFSLSPEVRRQDAFYGIAVVSRHPRGTALAWRFLKERWTELAKIYGSNIGILGRFVQFGTGGLNTPEELADVRAFFAAHPVAALTRTLEQAYERITINIAWREKNLPDLLERFGE